MQQHDRREAEHTIGIAELTDRVRLATRPHGSHCTVVGIDGRAGSGKTTLAKRLAERLGEVSIIHTDYFASWQNPLDWSPRLITEALAPLTEGREARFQATDWTTGALGPWIRVPPASTILLEGFSAIRREHSPYLAYRIWVDAAPEVRLARGLERDGEQARQQWEAWMRTEDAFITAEHPERSADFVIAGDPTIDHDPDLEIVIRPHPQ
jgi:uridine kinase